jgi:hypothetical protein
VRQVIVSGDLAQHGAVKQINERKRREFEIVHERSRPRHAHEPLVLRQRLLLIVGVRAEIPQLSRKRRRRTRCAAAIKPVPPISATEA